MKKVRNPALDKYRLRRKPKRNSNFEYLSKFYSRAIFFITSGQKINGPNSRSFRKNQFTSQNEWLRKNDQFSKRPISKWPIFRSGSFKNNTFNEVAIFEATWCSKRSDLRKESSFEVTLIEVTRFYKWPILEVIDLSMTFFEVIYILKSSFSNCSILRRHF